MKYDEAHIKPIIEALENGEGRGVSGGGIGEENGEEI